MSRFELHESLCEELAQRMLSWKVFGETNADTDLWGDVSDEVRDEFLNAAGEIFYGMGLDFKIR